MIRLTAAPADHFERLAAAARGGAPGFRDAHYPLGAEPGSGRVFFRAGANGSIVVDVDSRAWVGGSAHAQVRRLFATGRGTFPSTDALSAFCRGPLAAAFARPWASRRAGLAREVPAPADFDWQELAEALGRRVRGQEPALETISSVVAAHLAKHHPRRPAGLLLLGPTGVGKTSAIEALPVALAEVGYAGELSVHRVDCAELSEPHRVAQLLGAPPGYVGFGEETGFIDFLRRPGVLLLDEIEKAHPVFYTTLLGMLDVGRVTSGRGEVVDARRSIVCMTSNLGHDLEDELDEAALYDRSALRGACRRLLRQEGVLPEVIGRIGGFALFRVLDDETLVQVAVDSVRRLGSEYGLAVTGVDRVVALTVLDMAGASEVGVRGLEHAAADLVGHAFARAARPPVIGTVEVLAGPPIELRAAAPTGGDEG